MPQDSRSASSILFHSRTKLIKLIALILILLLLVGQYLRVLLGGGINSENENGLKQILHILDVINQQPGILPVAGAWNTTAH